MGDEVYEKLWKPLLIGKFSDRYKDVNMAWMWARIKARSLRLGTYRGGFQMFLNDLAAAVQSKGAVLKLNSPVERISRHGDNQLALSVNGEKHVFDAVLSTTSPALMLKITFGLMDTDYGHRVANLESIGALCVVFALKQSLLTDGTYWLSLPSNSPDKTRAQFPFLALVEHTNWMDKTHYDNDVIVYCGDYVPSEHQYFSMSEDELIAHFAQTLPKFNPDFKADWIKRAWVFRAPYAQPVPSVNHSQHIPSVKTPLPGLYWASMSQVYPWDRGTNYAVELGRQVAQQMMEEARENR
jgi:protoporphyrinogen oxidase